MTIKNKKGFTLVELIIVLALLGIVIMMGLSILSFSYKSFDSQVDNIDNQSKVQYAINEISKKIRSDSTGITIPGGITADGKISGEIITVGGVEYTLEQNVLYKTDSLNNKNKLVSGIKSFTTSIEGNKVTLEITSQANRGREFTLTSEIYIRE